MSLRTYGLDPLTDIGVALGTTLINDVFKPPSGPSPQQIAAALAAQQAQQQRQTIMAVALVAGAALLAVVLAK